ncbi:MAG: hypothetical protein P4L93_01685 [Coriobacteriia bacterium]|nr:hypothetical protein [Coriobacteriia bacterium]
MKRRLLMVLVVVLVMALAIPGTAFGFNWVHSPTSPLVVGGVHSHAKFTSLMLHSSRVKKAVKMVLKADGDPSWVYGAAIAEVKAGAIHSAFLAHGTRIGAMAFGPKWIKLAMDTRWMGSFKLPYYYVNASNSVTENGFLVTTTYRVALSKTCANPFVFGRTVTRKQILFKLYVEKRENTADGPQLGSWEITGTVGTDKYDSFTSTTTPTLIGSFAPGTPYSLGEVLQEGWTQLTPAEGPFTGTMPSNDLTLIFVNRPPEVIN